MALAEEGEDSFINYDGDVDVERLQLALEILSGTEPLKGVLDRDAHVFTPSESGALPTFDLTPDFFEVV